MSHVRAFGLILVLSGCLQPLRAQELPQKHATFLRALASELEAQCAKDPTDASLWVRLGSIRTRLGQVDKAAQALERARTLRPADPEIHAQADYVKFLNGDREAAPEDLRGLPARYPKSALAYYYLGLVEGRLGKSGAAERALETAHELNPQDPNIALAWLHERRKHTPPPDLSPAFRELLDQAPQNYEIRYEYAEMLLDLKNPVAAVSVARPLAQEYPDWVPGHLLLARGFAMANDQIHAAFELEHVPLRALDTESLLALGKAKARLGHSEDAIRYLQLALRLKPDFIDAQRELAGLYLGIGMENRAEEILHLILERSPRDYNALGMLAYIQQSHGQYDHAVADLKKLTDLDPSRPEAFEALGSIALNRGNYAQAAQYFQQALDKGEKDPRLFEELGQASSKLGKQDEALAYFRRSIELNPNRAGAHYMLGQLLARLGRSAEAAKEIEVARKLSEKSRSEVRGGVAMAPAIRQ